jgi:hypothetical protein
MEHVLFNRAYSFELSDDYKMMVDDKLPKLKEGKLN